MQGMVIFELERRTSSLLS